VAGLHPSPVGKADFVSSTTHKTMRGLRGGFILAKKEYGERLDKAIFPGIQGGPLMHVIAAKAVAFKEALSPNFLEYQRQVVRNAKVLAEELQQKGFKLVTGGTDNHLLLVDLTPQGITGKEAENLLSKAGIVVNKNTIPFDKRGPQVTSGIRIGTPAATTRGLKEEEMRHIASWIHQILTNPNQEDLPLKIKAQVEELLRHFPLKDTNRGE
jgi:glycine hydroxymethyltransferase